MNESFAAASAAAETDGQSLQSGVSSYGLMLLLPDLVRSESTWESMVRRLRPLRLEVAAITPLMLRSEQYAALYADSVVKEHNRGRPGAAWLGQQLVSLDMSVPLLVRTPLPIDLCAVLTEWKGSSGYGMRHAGDLRECGPVSDRCVSLIHTPDSQAELRKDLSVLYGERLATCLLHGEKRRTVPLNEVLTLRSYVDASNEPHPYDLILRCVLRVRALVCYDARVEVSLEGGTRCLARITAIRDKLWSMRGRDVIAALADSLREMADALPAPDTPMTGSFTLVLRRRELLARIHQLCDLAAWGSGLASQLIEAFQSNELYLDQWEQHRLTAALTFLPQH
jgi:hypothetical protein